MTAIEGWISKPLSKLLSLVLDFRGKTPKKLGMQWGNGDIPALSANNVAMGKLDFSKECYFASEALYRKWMTKGDPQRGDIILTTEAPLGNVAQIPDDRRYVLSQRTILLRADDEQVCSGYLRQYLTSEWFQSLMRQQSSGTTATGIQRAKLETLPVAFPISKLEQSAIAEILSTIDATIEQTEALIAKQKRIRNGLLHDLLTRGIDGRGTLRSEATHMFVDSSVGRVPLEWEVQTLGRALHKACGFLQTGPFGSQLHAVEYVAEGVPVVMPQNIVSGRVSTAHIARVPESRANDLRRHRLQPNDIVFSRRGELSRAAAISVRETGWLCGTGCFLLRVSAKEIDSPWLAELYRHHYVQRQIDANAVGSTMPSLNSAVMEQLTIAFPPIDEQKEITVRRDAADMVLVTMRRSLQKLLSLKKALMQDLLTGHRRVTDLLLARNGLAGRV
jgi:type I restriction enzyme, S subunit